MFLVSILGTTATYTLQGRLSDIFGRRYFFLGGAAFAFIGFIVSGTANSLGAIIGGVSLVFLNTTGAYFLTSNTEPPDWYRYGRVNFRGYSYRGVGAGQIQIYSTWRHFRTPIPYRGNQSWSR